MENVHQGEFLRKKLKGEGFKMGEIAEKLELTRQGLNYHFQKERLDDDFLRLIKEKLGIILTDKSKEFKLVPFGHEKEEIITALATSSALVDQMAKLMSFVYKRDVLECKDDLLSSISLKRKSLIGE